VADDLIETAAGRLPRRLFYFSGGFLWQRQVRRILTLAGHELCLGLPGPGDGVVVWGQSPRAARGLAVAARRGVPVVRVEDAFLRSLRPGRSGEAPLGLMIDGRGVQFDGSAPSDLEHLLATHPLDDSNLLARAREGIERLKALDLSKYNIHAEIEPPAPGYVLLIDQLRGDASAPDPSAFPAMLAQAVEDHPNARIVIKTHPEAMLGLRKGHFAAPLPPRVSLCADPVSPWRMLEGAIAVYTVSSQMGFEAILAGHRPKVFGQPFYAGWGLTDDQAPISRRKRRLTRAQLFAAAMILAPRWYDPCRDRLCRFEEAVDQLEAEVRAFRQDRMGHVAVGMRLWKRGHMQAFFGRETPLIFCNAPAAAEAAAARTGRGLLIWGTQAPELAGLRVEDGFLRSRGLGADLVPPLSLIADDLGLYYDPARESRLERQVRSPPPGGLARAERLRERIVALGLSKYNLPGTLPDLPEGHRILVPGQVEDDASILCGTTEIRTNLELLRAARAANPDAVLVYKPHPDVEAGLRPGAIDAAGLADVVATGTDAIALILACEEVWTMTSLLGFEALLRGKPVTTLGAPFYAGWGLTRDLGNPPLRRRQAADGHPLPRVTLDHLVHAALIASPRYYDPVTRRPCPPEVALDRLADATPPPRRLLAKAQGALAGWAHLWR
jgi:capsular polysaccharide export protein